MRLAHREIAFVIGRIDGDPAVPFGRYPGLQRRSGEEDFLAGRAGGPPSQPFVDAGIGDGQWRWGRARIRTGRIALLTVAGAAQVGRGPQDLRSLFPV